MVFYPPLRGPIWVWPEEFVLQIKFIEAIVFNLYTQKVEKCYINFSINLIFFTLAIGLNHASQSGNSVAGLLIFILRSKLNLAT
jgi:hypothetical protein